MRRLLITNAKLVAVASNDAAPTNAKLVAVASNNAAPTIKTLPMVTENTAPTPAVLPVTVQNEEQVADWEFVLAYNGEGSSSDCARCVIYTRGQKNQAQRTSCDPEASMQLRKRPFSKLAYS